ncbi:ATP-binding protein [Pseudaminobacter sp. NGMCC 1.201702]|uniref:ATP-binding protein n=1 Tax=Pseudaminobacter sp. NGMCC 1.201702 TaxID=3391825 RepID=UPI0039EF4FF4
MSTTRFGEIVEAATAGCDRLVSLSITKEDDRARQRRLVGIFLAAPFFLAAAFAFFLSASLGPSMTLALICATFSLAWIGVLLVSSSARDRIAGIVGLVSGTIVLSVLVAAAGGIASPLAVLILALPFEAYWQRRAAGALLWGGVAALSVLPIQTLLGSMFFPISQVPAAWHWLVPVAYAATVIIRIVGALETARAEEQEDGPVRLETIVDGVVVRMSMNGDVTDVSPQARTMLRLAPELMLGAGLFERIHISDRVGYLCALADLRAGAPRRTVEARMRLPRTDDARAGQADNYQPFAIDLMSADGKGIVALLRENEEVVRLRAAVAACTETTEALELAKARFLAAVSHELRTPLNAIIGFSDMLLHEMFGGFRDPRQKEYVGLVRDSGHHLLAVVNSILDVSKIEAGAYATNPEPFRFAEAVEMCHSMMSLQAQAKSISLTSEVSPEVGEIHADKRAVQQVLINLVSNAIKFTPDGGAVSVSAKRIGSRLHFWVEDSGIGIAEDDLGRLGKPFTQVHNEYTRQFEGTGLGLALVKGLVTLHEGTMSIESAPGEGTTVTISLPVAGPSGDAGRQKGALLSMTANKVKENSNGALRKAG